MTHATGAPCHLHPQLRVPTATAQQGATDCLMHDHEVCTVRITQRTSVKIILGIAVCSVGANTPSGFYPHAQMNSSRATPHHPPCRSPPWHLGCGAHTRASSCPARHASASTERVAGSEAEGRRGSTNSGGTNSDCNSGKGWWQGLMISLLIVRHPNKRGPEHGCSSLHRNLK